MSVPFVHRASVVSVLDLMETMEISCFLPSEETSCSLPPEQTSCFLPLEETSYSLPPEETSWFLPPKETSCSIPPNDTTHDLWKVDNIDRLVAILCTIWIGRFHLHENVARFHRERKPYAPSQPSNANERNSPGSYVFILKSGKNNVMSDQVRAKEMEAWDAFICNDSHESELSDDDDDDAEDDGSQSVDKVTTDIDVERVSESSCMHNNDLLYDNNHNNIMSDKDKVLSEDVSLKTLSRKWKSNGKEVVKPVSPPSESASEEDSNEEHA
ncbi:hypothetical protein Tco_0826598 [Tanacetum coccineum]